MKTALFILFILANLTALGQSTISDDEVENVLNALVKKGVLDKAVNGIALQITPYQFDGDYSRERVFPNASPNSVICVVPITFDTSIHSVLKKIDDVYDSSYYQNLIQDYLPVRWSEQELNLKKIKFIKSKIGKLFHKEIGLLTYPLFSKDGKTAILTYGTVNRNSVIKEREAVYILKKMDPGWQVVEVINSKETW